MFCSFVPDLATFLLPRFQLFGEVMDYDIAVIPGDGIGPEVIGETMKVLSATSKIFGFDLKFETLPYGAGYYLKHKEVLPSGALERLAGFKALLLGAVGDPRVPPGPLEQELLLALRFHFDQFLNLRPAQTYPNVPIPLGGNISIDIDVVRENTEDFYMGLGAPFSGSYTGDLAAGRGEYEFTSKVEIQVSPPRDCAFALGLLTQPAVERIAHRAFKLAEKRGENSLHVATKANALPQFYGLWDEWTAKTAKNYPNIKLKKINVDNLCYQLPRTPAEFGVILCPNLFGDIVSDLVSALTGGLGLAASGNIGDGLCMFEPVHGSAPDIAGTGRSNPLAAILSGAMLLEHIGQIPASSAVKQAVRDYLSGGQNFPYELGGETPFDQVGDLVTAKLMSQKYA
ncbi:MAG: isocitrate/isopropylmalate dehydrogenase family protein [Deltaproteobacteria bacterium]|jgi:3-isopropylmalate dehydrogenase|nr:isocitrate/isopropylmalate dehydrogenase family protein [Deltaproteobacteria bacterium]